MPQLLDEHGVAIGVDRLLEGLQPPFLLAVHAHRLRDVVPHDDAVLADQLARATIGPLQVIEVHIGDRAVIEAQQKIGVVLGVDLEAGELVGVAKHLARVPQQPAHVVQLVNRVENDPAAHRPLSAVAPAIVRLGAPVRQVVAALGAGR